MSLAGILAALDSQGEAELARVRAEAEAQAQVAQAEAEARAEARRAAARLAAAQPARGLRARRLQRARLEALCRVGNVRDRLVEAALDQTRARLMDARAALDYPLVLRRLLEEALAALGQQAEAGDKCRLEVDARDEALVAHILNDLGLELPLSTGLVAWGGLVVRSADGRIVVTNTLEARLERATPYVRQDLAGFFEQACQASTTPTPA